jgi:hypothetical protein
MRYVASPQLVSVNGIIDIDSFFPDIAPQLLDELPGHIGPEQLEKLVLEKFGKLLRNGKE